MSHDYDFEDDDNLWLKKTGRRSLARDIDRWHRLGAYCAKLSSSGNFPKIQSVADYVSTQFRRLREKSNNEEVDNEEVDNEEVDNEEVDNEEVDNEEVDNEEVDNEETLSEENSKTFSKENSEDLVKVREEFRKKKRKIEYNFCTKPRALEDGNIELCNKIANEINSNRGGGRFLCKECLAKEQVFASNSRWITPSLYQEKINADKNNRYCIYSPADGENKGLICAKKAVILQDSLIKGDYRCHECIGK